MQQLPQATNLSTPTAQLLLGLQPGLRLSALPSCGCSLCQASELVLHPRAFPALQSLALTPSSGGDRASARSTHQRTLWSKWQADQFWLQLSDGSAAGHSTMKRDLHRERARVGFASSVANWALILGITTFASLNRRPRIYQQSVQQSTSRNIGEDTPPWRCARTQLRDLWVWEWESENPIAKDSYDGRMSESPYKWGAKNSLSQFLSNERPAI